MQATARSDLLSASPSAPPRETPEAAVRRAVQHVTDIELPATKSLQLFHVRGVSSQGPSDGQSEKVIFPPEFMYVLDIGFPALAGVSINMFVAGLGDPAFPDFSDVAVRTLSSTDPREVAFPAVAGQLLVGVQEGTSEATVRAGLGDFVKSIEKLLPTVYLANVNAFHETKIGQQIETSVGFVRYFELNRIQRLIDFAPGWRVSRVC